MPSSREFMSIDYWCTSPMTPAISRKLTEHDAFDDYKKTIRERAAMESATNKVTEVHEDCCEPVVTTKQLEERIDLLWQMAISLYAQSQMHSCRTALQLWWESKYKLARATNSSPPDTLETPEYYFGNKEAENTTD